SAAEDARVEYQPLVQSMNRIGGAPLGDGHTVIMWDNIKSVGSTQYAYLLGVFDNAKQEPVYFVASEINQMAAAFGGGSHCLGVFNGSGHANMGFSDDWGDPNKFFSEAIRIVSERFGVPLDDGDAPTATRPSGGASGTARKPWWRFW
ncbi:hypothetical protein R5W24_006644, partial [Gemmata sp. JC717]|uniref:hypothetical protein n=1 Tax=Gemmata algarum TaxID=2975278 RepID=UPI0021BB0BB9